MQNKILIELDFKQKFVIGLSPRQVNEEYYKQVQRSCLGFVFFSKIFFFFFLKSLIIFSGFGIYFIDKNDEIKLINFDVISSDLIQDAHAAIRGFRLLREQPFFKEIDKKEYIVWCDTGKHFRNNEMLGFLLLELAQQQIHGNIFFLRFKSIIKKFFSVNLNYFAEKHGKNGRDAHFSNLARFVKSESLVRKLICSQDIVDAIIYRQKMANENNEGK